MRAVKRLLGYLVPGLVVALVLAGCGSFTSYAAKVNGRRITQNELDRELNAVLNNKAYLDQIDQGFARQAQEGARGSGAGTLNSVFVAGLLERRIAFELIHQEVERRKLETTPEDMEAARGELLASVDNDERILNAFPKSYRDELTRSFAEVAVLERALTQTPVDDAAIRAYYEEHKESFESFCLRAILLGERAQAERVKSRVESGADFAAIARAESRDNQGPGGGSAAKGGDLGCAARSELGAFEPIAARLQPGQVSDPLESGGGFIVFQVTERKPRSFEESAGEVRQRLEQQSVEGLRAFVNESFLKAKITVNPRYGEFVQSGDDIGVRAPSELTTTTVSPTPAP